MGRLITRILEFLTTKVYRAWRRIKRRWAGEVSPKRKGAVKEIKAYDYKSSPSRLDNQRSTSVQYDNIVTSRPATSSSDADKSQVQGKNTAVDADGETSAQVNFLLPVIITIVYMLLGVLMYRALGESWTFTDAFYFIFISFATIGFGDVMPAHPRYFMATSIYILLGLSLMATIVNVMMEKMHTTFTVAKDSAVRGLGLEETLAIEASNIRLPIKGLCTPDRVVNCTVQTADDGRDALNAKPKSESEELKV